MSDFYPSDGSDYEDDYNYIRIDDIAIFLAKHPDEFMKEINFTDRETELNVDIESKKERDCVYVKTQEVGTQKEGDFEISFTNTERKEFFCSGMNHVEGGWGKEYQLDDYPTIERFRRKIVKDEKFKKTLKKLGDRIENALLTNQCLQIFDEYEWDEEEMYGVHFKDPTINSVSVLRDLSEEKRNVSSMSWSTSKSDEIAVSYSSWEFYFDEPYKNNQAYIYNIEDSTNYVGYLESCSPITNLAYNPIQGVIIAGGTESGHIGIWDTRKGVEASVHTGYDDRHYEPVYKLIWTNPVKQFSEFMTGSSDGYVKWWDMRCLKAPIQHLLVGAQELAVDANKTADTITALEFEPSIPMRFMIGTSQGNLYGCMKKGKSRDMIVSKLKAHSNSIYSIERNPFIPKMILTVGGWKANVWCEHLEESIIKTRQSTESLNCGRWSTGRSSVYYTGRNDGVLQAWDILYTSDEPVISLKVAHSPLRCIEPHQDYMHLAIGTDEGGVHILRGSDEIMLSTKAEKFATVDVFDRESKRERIIDRLNKEKNFKGRIEQRKLEAEMKELEQIQGSIMSLKKQTSSKEERKKMTAGMFLINTKKSIKQKNDDQRSRLAEELFFQSIKDTQEARARNPNLKGFDVKAHEFET